MRNLKRIIVFLMAAVLAVGFFSSCKAASTSYSDAEKAVLINKAIQGGGTAARSLGTPSGKEITGGGIAVAIGSAADFTGSQFKTEIDGWSGTTSTFINLTYTNLAVTVTDDSGNTVTVVMNGSIAYGYNAALDGSITMDAFGTVTGTVGDDSYNFLIDLKSAIIVSGTTTALTLTGTAGGVTISQTYSYSTS